MPTVLFKEVIEALEILGGYIAIDMLKSAKQAESKHNNTFSKLEVSMELMPTMTTMRESITTAEQERFDVHSTQTPINCINELGVFAAVAREDEVLSLEMRIRKD